MSSTLLNERVVLPDGRKGTIVATHPRLENIVLVQPDMPDQVWYTVQELEMDDRSAEEPS